MSLRKEAVGKLEEESRAWEEARQALENQVSQKSFKSFLQLSSCTCFCSRVFIPMFAGSESTDEFKAGRGVHGQ